MSKHSISQALWLCSRPYSFLQGANCGLRFFGDRSRISTVKRAQQGAQKSSGVDERRWVNIATAPIVRNDVGGSPTR